MHRATLQPPMSERSDQALETSQRPIPTSARPKSSRRMAFAAVAAAAVAALVAVTAMPQRGNTEHRSQASALPAPKPAGAPLAQPATLIDHSVVQSRGFGSDQDLTGASIAAYER